MPSRNELVIRGRMVGLTASNYPNDSKFEQKILWLEKNASAQTGTISTTTLTSSATATDDGGTITIGSAAQGGKTYTNKTALTETKATGTYTNASTAVAGETITIDGITYTYFDAIDNTIEQPYAVLVGVNPTASLANLILAIDKGATEGTNYGMGTVAHPRISGVSSDATTAVVTYDTVGVKGNTALVSEVAAGSWDHPHLQGGLDSVANEVLIGSTANGAAQLVNFKAALIGTTSSGTLFSSATAPHPLVTPGAINATTLVIDAKDFGILNTAIDTTDVAAELSFTGSDLGSGVTKVVADATTTTGGGPGVSGDKNIVI